MVIIIVVAAVIKKTAATSAQNTLEIHISYCHTHTPLFLLNFLLVFLFFLVGEALYIIDNMHVHVSAVSLIIIYVSNCVVFVIFGRSAIFGTHAFFGVKSIVTVQHSYWLTVI